MKLNLIQKKVYIIEKLLKNKIFERSLMFKNRQSCEGCSSWSVRELADGLAILQLTTIVKQNIL